MAIPDKIVSSRQAFFAGIWHAWTSVFFLVLAGTYIGVGALAHDFGFSALWLTASTMFVWAAPAQIILISSLGTGTSLIAGAVAVWLSAIRLFPMVVALLPLLRGEGRKLRHLILPAHFTSISMWIESLRLLPDAAREFRLALCLGISVGYMSTAMMFGLVGFYLAAGLPPLLAGMLLFLSPLSFLVSTLRNARDTMEYIAFGLGLVISPVLAYYKIELDLLWTGLAGGLIAYAITRLRRNVGRDAT